MRLTRRSVCAGMLGCAMVDHAAAQTPDLPVWSDIATIMVRDAAGAPIPLGRLAGRTGRPILLSFWATWCAPCLPEGRHFGAIRRRTPEAQLAMIGVNLDRNQDAGRLAGFRDRADMIYTQALGEAGLFIVATRETGLALPRAHLYDRAGALTNVFAGFSPDRSPTAIDAALEGALAT